MEIVARHIVVLGGGFGGLTFCDHFSDPSTRITIVDRQNHHLFQPLLYQVATAGLSAPDIAQPIRSILADRENITVVMDEVREIKLSEKQVVLGKSTLHYDFLIIALGSATSYFGHPEWEAFAPGLKSLDDALKIRGKILYAFERAENETDAAKRSRLLTIVVVGGGPTGVELAGAFAELARTVLAGDFRHIDPRKARVILIEASPRILGTFPESLSNEGLRQLKHLGVEVRTSCRVKNITAEGVELENETIPAENVIWGAGVAASPLTKNLGVEIDRAGRIKVNPDLSLPGHPEVFGLGDIVTLHDRDGQLVPGVSPAAMQMAKHAARIVEEELMYGKSERIAFDYWDKGSMATIGRSAAVAKMGGIQFSGFVAWIAWLTVHLVFLIGFRNRLTVFLQWVYSYLTYRRGARIITNLRDREKSGGA